METHVRLKIHIFIGPNCFATDCALKTSVLCFHLARRRTDKQGLPKEARRRFRAAVFVLLMREELFLSISDIP